MKEIPIISRTTPAKPRSANYPISSSPSGGGGVVSVSPGGSAGVDIIKVGDSTAFSDSNVLSSLRTNEEFISRKKDSTVTAVVDYLKGLKINGVPITRILNKDTEEEEFLETDIMSALRVIAEIAAHDEELKKLFLRKDAPDIAEEIITFLKGLLIGKNGSGITVLENGMSQAVVDYLYVRVKAVFDELEIKRKTYVGGEQVISHAGMKCIRVEELDDAYRCYFKAEEEGIEINNQFTVGSLAIAQECNIKTGVSQHAGNRYYWRLVTSVGADYIDLSKTVCDPNVENDKPAAGDDIVGLGHKTDITRQAAIIMSSVNEVSPSIILYQGINDFTLVGKEVIAFEYDKATGKARMRVYGDTYIGAKDESEYISYKDGHVDIKGSVHIQPNSTGAANLSDLPGFIQQAQQMGTVNLLRNSGFTGDYETEELAPDTELAPDSEMYSKALEFWTGMATVQEDAEAVSGRSAVIGSLSQSVALINRELYVVSYKAKGESVDVSCGDFSVSQPLTSDYQRYTHSFTFSGAGVFMLGGTATVCDVQLERGTIATDWKPSPLDNDKSMAEFQALSYIYDVLKNGSVDIIGGLILSSMIQLGNYKDGKMRKVTAGVSGVYNDDDDVYTWGGGTLEQAIRTVMKYKENPKYQPTPEELKTMANIVLTHGGRAILNDVIVRGYVYALGGYFKGTVEIAGGKILLNEDGSGRLADGTIYWDTYGRMFQKSRSIILWRSMAEEMYEQGVTDRYDVDFHAGTYLNVNNGGPTDGRTINLPAASGTPDMVLDIRANLIGRLAGAYPIGCEADGGIRVYNTDTKAYDTLQAVYFSKEIDSGILEDTIESIEDSDGYHWYAGRLFTGNQ